MELQSELSVVKSLLFKLTSSHTSGGILPTDAKLPSASTKSETSMLSTVFADTVEESQASSAFDNEESTDTEDAGYDVSTEWCVQNKMKRRVKKQRSRVQQEALQHKITIICDSIP